MNVAIQFQAFQQVSYNQLPEKNKLLKIARLYANAFAGWPWNEYKVCPNNHITGRQVTELTNCIKCNETLELVYPEEKTADYIAEEVSKPDGDLLIVENEVGEVLAAGWGYTCDTEMLQAKYNSLEMKEKVARRAMMTAQKVFYISEIMVAPEKQGQGIATNITRDLLETAQSLNLNAVMRTRGDSPMVKIANKMQMTQVISVGEDTDDLERVLYIKI